MASSRFRAYRIWAVAAVLLAAGLAGIGSGPATADVTAVRGSALGFQSNVSLFGGPSNQRGPSPTVTLPAGGSATPVTATEPTGSAVYGPATIFSSNTLTVSTQGTTGATGSVTSSATVSNLNTSQSEILTAGSVSSTCTANEAGRSGSTTLTNAVLIVTDPDPDVAGEAGEQIVNLPTNPAPNTTFNGTISPPVSDNFQYIFNEQIPNTDGSLTVNAAHLRLLGPTAVGDVIIGQSVCGVTAVAATTTTTSGGGATTTTAGGGNTTTTASGNTTTTAGGNTTTTAAGATTTSTTSAGATTTTTAAGATTTTTTGGTTGVGGGAYGYFVTVGLFGGPPNSKGPDPTVTLPAGGSATPVTGTSPSGIAQFGPATLYTSDALTVSTQGTPGGTVTSSARATNVNKSTVNASQTGSESLTADTISSTCSSSASGETGSVTLAGGRLTTSVGTNFDSEADDVTVPIPDNPAPNTSFDGKIENVGDAFRIVFNEQQRSAGSITVNAVHMYLLGPIAKGELIIAQSRCGTTAAAGGGGGGTVTATGAGGVASTGTHAVRLVALGLLLAAIGGHVGFGVPGLRWADADPGPGALRRRMPWGRRRRLR